MSPKELHPNQVSAPAVAFVMVLPVPRHVQLYAHTRIPPYSQKGFIPYTPPPLPAASEGGKGPAKVMQPITAPQGRISSPMAPAGRCLCNLPLETSCKGRPTSSPQLSNSRLSGVTQRIFPRCPNYIALPQAAENCSALGEGSCRSSFPRLSK